MPDEQLYLILFLEHFCSPHVTSTSAIPTTTAATVKTTSQEITTTNVVPQIDPELWTTSSIYEASLTTDYSTYDPNSSDPSIAFSKSLTTVSGRSTTTDIDDSEMNLFLTKAEWGGIAAAIIIFTVIVVVIIIALLTQHRRKHKKRKYESQVSKSRKIKLLPAADHKSNDKACVKPRAVNTHQRSCNVYDELYEFPVDKEEVCPQVIKHTTQSFDVEAKMTQNVLYDCFESNYQTDRKYPAQKSSNSDLYAQVIEINRQEENDKQQHRKQSESEEMVENILYHGFENSSS